jgi:hypothetical protein
LAFYRNRATKDAFLPHSRIIRYIMMGEDEFPIGAKWISLQNNTVTDLDLIY